MRVDTFLEEGSSISPYYDSLIAKLIVWAEDRDSAIARGIRALEELELEGIPTTRELALDVLRSPEFRSGEYSTTFLADVEERLPALAPRVRHDGHVLEGAGRGDQDPRRCPGRPGRHGRGARRRVRASGARAAVST